MERKAKNFWLKKEGQIGGVITAIAIAAGIFMGAPIVLPIINAILADFVTACVLGFISLGFIYILFAGNGLNLIWYFYKSFSRFLTSIVVEVDPIGILKSYIDDLRKKYEITSKSMVEVDTQRVSLRRAIEGNERELRDVENKYQQALQRGVKDIVSINQINRLKESNRVYENLYQGIEKAYNTLSQIREGTNIMIQDLSNEVVIRERERKVLLATHSAFADAVSVIRGDSGKKEMFDQSLEFLADDYASKIADINEYLQISSSFMKSIDFATGSYEEDSLKMLEAWNPTTIIDTQGKTAATQTATVSNSSTGNISRYLK